MSTIINLSKIAGVVVLYNSSYSVYSNIASYVCQVEKLYVVDNSTQPNYELIELLSRENKVIYHSFNGNKGIATALNWAANRAISDGFMVLLTMDDDTRTPHGMVHEMVNFWNQYPRQIGILSGHHHTRPLEDFKLDKVSSKELPYTLTSGNLLSLEAFQLVGLFRDDFFIDHVDHEYGLRLNRAGFSVVEMKNICLEHRLGYTQQITVGKHVLFTYGSHSPTRLYYFARNGVYMVRRDFKENPRFAYTVIKELTKRWIKALFLQKNRFERIGMLMKGINHGWNGKLGEYNTGEKY
ncbi:rhamnosyltransferase [Spirosoma oryzae]|uniref:Rhamnosyltransferase n=1 Tax=Spirosoma oryzae TaxID=1469603 RepID=A0A2T0RGJ8_9BACT|nr:glycosyltransferase [Spirosoma oryzae]PRY20285.1 rhamnosyltransferase [Spirosoma oryzae]